MDTFLANKRSLEEDRMHRGFNLQEETKPAIENNLEFEIDTHLASEIDTKRNDGTTATVTESFERAIETLSSTDNPRLQAPLDYELESQLRDRQLQTS
jgi:hypothetical protein